MPPYDSFYLLIDGREHLSSDLCDSSGTLMVTYASVMPDSKILACLTAPTTVLHPLAQKKDSGLGQASF